MGRGVSVAVALFLVGGSVGAGDVQFRVVDGQSGAPLCGVKVTRYYCEFQWISWAIPKKCWSARQTAFTDKTGYLHIDRPAGSDQYLFEAAGYVPATAHRSWFHYRVCAESSDNCETAELVDCTHVVRLYHMSEPPCPPKSADQQRPMPTPGTQPSPQSGGQPGTLPTPGTPSSPQSGGQPGSLPTPGQTNSPAGDGQPRPDAAAGQPNAPPPDRLPVPAPTPGQPQDPAPPGR
jgi:hypothetical protein